MGLPEVGGRRRRTSWRGGGAGKCLTRPTRRRVRCSAGRKWRVDGAWSSFGAGASQKLEISSRRSFWYGRCRKNRSDSPESSPEIRRKISPADFNMSVLAANMHRNSKWEVIKVAFLHPLLIVNWLKMFPFETPKIVEVHMQVNLLASSNCAKESYHGESVHPSYSLGG
ncbi:hypothetical protein CK203_000845 [Vitis vinifera]|uniref:Uncharacterized protein n=1 Tax=Vitis vinifera TaxID=29760 RepID=A0A438KR42_VITVI|nr:hypothetical protein CK203_000845 [Vitis vinifera]